MLAAWVGKKIPADAEVQAPGKIASKSKSSTVVKAVGGQDAASQGTRHLLVQKPLTFGSAKRPAAGALGNLAALFGKPDARPTTKLRAASTKSSFAPSVDGSKKRRKSSSDGKAEPNGRRKTATKPPR